jgi:hypothetical protein
MTTIATRTISSILLSALCACSAGRGDKQSTSSNQEQQSMNAPSAPTSTAGDASASVATGCDASLWGHVYNPSRLQQLASCVTATGIVEESAADPDGDQHFLLKLDPGQDALVNKRNNRKTTGDLVVEIVCANPPSQKKAKQACAGYTNRIAIPAVGAHVRATGTHVLDSHNGWTEIHPVSKLEKI